MGGGTYQPEYRPATEADREFLRALSRGVFSRYGDYETILDDYFDLKGCHTVVVEVSGQPVGFYMLADDPREPALAHLLALAVAPGWQGRGIGRAALDRVIAEVRAQARDGEVRWIELEVADDNVRARRLFERSGWTRDPGDAGRYPGGQRALGMSLKV